MKDLVALHCGFPDSIGEPPLINFRKMAQLSMVISCLTRIQAETPVFSANTDLIDTLKLAIDVFYSDEEIFELSLAREPRPSGSNSGVSLVLSAKCSEYNQREL